MADESGNRSKGDHKLFSKSKWKGKIFTKEDAGPRDQEDENIRDFLGQPSMKSPVPRPPTGNPAVSLNRLDVSKATRWPTAAEVNRLGEQNSSRPSTSGRSRSPKRKTKKGLSVGFTDQRPEIIGEGGDESDVPPIEISRSRSRSLSPELRRSTDAGMRPPSQDGPIQRKPVPPLNTDFKPMPLRRRPTGFEDQADSGVKRQDSYGIHFDGDESPDLKLGAFESRSAHEAPGTNSFAARAQARMLAEEGRVLQSSYRGSPSGKPELEAAPPGLDLPPKYMLDPFQDSPETDSAPSPNYSLRPTPSPRPAQMYGPPPVANHPPKLKALPATLIHTSPTSLKSATTYDPSPQSSIAAPTPSSLHAATSALGDGTLEDFSGRVEHYSSLFHLAAESLKPIMETPFEEWLRAAVWWFLKGRSVLEAAIRARPPNSGPQVPIQAYVDLAKAWWIVQHICPQHPEPRRYGNGALGRLVDIARSHGDETMASLIEVHQSIIGYMRALTISMRRNDILPPQQDEAPLATGLDTSIWIKYPLFTPEICSILAGKTSKSLVLEAPSSKYSLKETIPLGDTKNDFSLGRMFVEVSLSDEEEGSEQFILPCILSALRERKDWQIKLVIASQNALVNINVQTTGKFGTTWENVRWRAKQFQILIQLPRKFTLTVQLKEKDFKTLWGIYDYTEKIESSLQPELGEELVCDSILQNFQYIDLDPKAKVFPKEPVKRCRARLFEKSITRKDGTGTRKLHRGYRLLVVTSPKVKTMSSVSHNLGTQKCIEFSLLRGSDGDPAMLIKDRDAKGERVSVLSFEDEAERKLMHSHLIGAAPMGEEILFTDVELKSVSIESSSPAEGFSQSGHDVLKKFKWERLRVIKRDPEDRLPNDMYGQTLPENLRIIADAQEGSTTDRVNLGTLFLV